jgi:adenylate cyclase
MAKPERFELGAQRVVLGRALDCDIVLMHSMVSRRHAEIEPAGAGRWRVIDKGSANKVYVNEVEVAERLLSHGDQVRLGQEVVLTFEDPARAGKGAADADTAPPAADASKSGRFGPPARPADTTATSQRNAPAGAAAGTGGAASGGVQRLAGETLAVAAKVSELRRDFAAPGESHTLLGIVSDFRRRQDKPQATGLARKESFHFFVLFQLAQLSNQSDTVEQFYKQALDLLLEAMGGSFAAVLLVGKDGELTTRLAAGPDLDGPNPPQVSRNITRRVVEEKVAVLTRDAVTDPRFMDGASIAALRIHSAVCCPIWDADEVDGCIYVVAAETATFGEADRDLVTAVGHQLAVANRQEELRQRLREEAAVRSNLERYHSADVVEALMHGGQDALQVREADVSVLFADIEGFTPLSSRLPPAEVARILNGYFEGTTEAIFRHRGQVNKYIGDAIMAVFGAPIPNPDHAAFACRAALDMVKALERFRETLPASERFRIRIAINSGPVVAGNIGASKRLEYTVIGNAVNVAARLEKCAPPDGIAVGEETARRVRGRFRLRGLGPQELKGLAAPIDVFVVEGTA